MFVLRSTIQPGSWTQFRCFSKSLSQLERFSRESLRNRIYKQNLKDLTKQNVQQAGPSTPPYIADAVPVRPVKDLWKAFGFTVAVGVGSYSFAVVSDLERTRKRVKTMLETTTDFFKSSFSNLNLHKDDEEIISWGQLTPGDKTAVYLVAANLAVFCLWKIKGLQPVMWRYFSNSYASRSLCLPMLLSAFSHSSFIHCALNMYVVYSFTNVAIDKFLGQDQFWSFYCTAAVVSSFTSLMHKALIRSPIRALGASGAILGLLAYTCMKIPDARLKIVFLPFFDFSAESAIISLLLFDLAGLVLKFRLFDHAAHLGGTLFGIWYAKYGEVLLWDDFGSIVEDLYRRMRSESH